MQTRRVGWYPRRIPKLRTYLNKPATERIQKQPQDDFMKLLFMTLNEEFAGMPI